MRLIPPASPEIWRQEPGFVGLCEHIARCAAICYDSEPKRGGEAVDFVKRLIEMGHGRPLEFGTLRVKNVTENDFEGCEWLRSYIHRDGEWIYTNLRAWLYIFGGLDDIEEVCDDFTADIDRYPRVTVHYPAIARGIADEFRTHTTLSTLMQSTRYVRQGKDGDIEFVRPSWLDKADTETQGAFTAGLDHAAALYSHLIDMRGRKPQEARDALPLCVKTEMVQCGLVGVANSGWGNFLHLRTAKAAHPDAQWMAKEVHKLLNDERTRLKF